MDTDTVLDVGQGVKEYFFKRHPLQFIFLIILPVLISIGIGYLELTVGKTSLLQSKNSIQGAVLIFSIPLAFATVCYIIVLSKVEKIFYTQLAAALGCTYIPVSPPPATGQFSHMFTSGRNFRNVLSGTYATVPFLLGDYTYYTGSGKNRESHPYTLAILTLNAALPRVLCVPKNWISFILSEWKPSGMKELSLEGNFNTLFTVYVPEGGEIEALQILEPNVMEKLMAGFENFGFECEGPNVFLFSKGSMKENREAVLNLYTLLKRFCDTLTPELQSFATTAVHG